VNDRSTEPWASSTSHRGAYEVLAVLPSESAIHFYVYCSLIFLTLVLAIGTPAVVLFFAEHRPIAGVLFVAANLIIFSVVIVIQLRSSTDLPKPGRLRVLARRTLRKLQNFPRLNAIASRVVIHPGPSFRAFPSQSGTAGSFFFFQQCWREYAGNGSPLPNLFWSYQERKATARVVGRSLAPLVAISAGLVSLFPRKSDVVRVYLLHEFGHIAARDLEVFACTVAASRACIAILFSTTLISASVLLPFMDGGFFGGLILLVSTMWILVLGGLSILLVRYAGVIISLRELYADVQAVIWLRGFDVYKAILLDQPRSSLNQFLSRLRSLISLRLIHLSPAERLSFLEQPGALLYPRHTYYFLVALILVALQSNPFGEGYENNWMRWFFLLAWSPLGFAYLLNIGRTICGLGLLQSEIRFTRIVGLSLGVTIVLSLPMIRVPGLYSDILLSLGNWGSLRSSLTDSAKTLAARWDHPQYLAPIILAPVWLAINGWLARRQLKHLEFGLRTIDKLDLRNRSTLLISALAVIAETALLGIQDYGNTSVTDWDSLQMKLGQLRAAPPIAALSVLILGSFWVWRRRIAPIDGADRQK
jgi:Zn-dependent protease with chaperone function